MDRPIRHQGESKKMMSDNFVVYYCTTIQIIHLVRDPRAILNSRYFGGWKQKLQNYKYVCNHLRNDLKIFSLLPEERLLVNSVFLYAWEYSNFHSRYILVKYEDLVENTENVMRKLYRFSKIPFTKRIISHIKGLKSGSVQSSKSFYGLVRSSTFDYNHWRVEMGKQKIRLIEKECKDFMQLMNYTAF